MTAGSETSPAGFERRTLREPVFAPKLIDVAADPLRAHPVAGTGLTEQHAAVEVVDYLRSYMNTFQTAESESAVLASLQELVDSEEILPVSPRWNEAASILESGTVIGHEEFEAGVAAIAEDWIAYLADDPERQILMVPGPALISQHAGEGRYKSDSYMLERILQLVARTLGEDSVGSKIVGGPEALVAGSGKRRVALVEDAILSGRQASETLDYFAVRHPDLVDELEINLIVSDRETLEYGFMPLLDTQSDLVDTPQDGLAYEFERPIPVRAPYIAHERTGSDTRDEEFYAYYHLISTTHTIFDYGFANELRQMRNNLAALTPETSLKDRPLPNLAEGATFNHAYDSIDYSLSSRLWVGTEFDGKVFPRWER